MTGHEKRLQAVWEAFDAAKLVEICMAPEASFERYGTEFRTKNGEGKFCFFHQNNGPESQVLAVAHLDSVQDKKDAGVVQMASGRLLALSPQLDDRLGAYVICELLPKLGIKTDILLTIGEEVGKSTAKLFETDKKYNWMFQFDRTGTDVVMYQYRTEVAIKKLEEVGFRTAYGSMSDISYLDDLGCSGFNFGVGYHDYHSLQAYAILNDTFEMVARFVKFHKIYAREFMVYDRTKKSTPVTSVWDGHYSGGNQQNEFGRTENGHWTPNTIWDEKAQKWAVNEEYYKKYPDDPPPSERQLTRFEPYWARRGEPMRAPYGSDRGSTTNGGTQTPPLAADNGKEVKVLSSGGSLRDDDIEFQKRVRARLEAVDRLCMCGHSKFVHDYRGVKCSYWKCKCKEFVDANSAMGGI